MQPRVQRALGHVNKKEKGGGDRVKATEEEEEEGRAGEPGGARVHGTVAWLCLAS